MANDATSAFILKNRKTICGFLIILILFEALAVFIMVENYKENYLSREDAVAVALEDAGFSSDQVTNLDSDFETDDGKAWFEITFDYNEMTFNYKVDAETGEILDK